MSRGRVSVGTLIRALESGSETGGTKGEVADCNSNEQALFVRNTALVLSEAKLSTLFCFVSSVLLYTLAGLL